MTLLHIDERLDAREFQQRFLTLHRQLFRSTEFDFNEVTTHVFSPVKGMAQFDHSFIHDGENWHLFYGTGNMKLSEEWIRRYRAGEWDTVNDVCLEPGNGHAVGPTLFDLKFKQHVFFPPQGRFDIAGRSVCSVFRYQNRYGMRSAPTPPVLSAVAKLPGMLAEASTSWAISTPRKSFRTTTAYGG